MGIDRQDPEPVDGRGLADGGETLTAGFEVHGDSCSWLAAVWVGSVAALSRGKPAPTMPCDKAATDTTNAIV
ncbi:hypothetical protein D3C76_1752840 [compost metagenome]